MCVAAREQHWKRPWPWTGLSTSTSEAREWVASWDVCWTLPPPPLLIPFSVDVL